MELWEQPVHRGFEERLVQTVRLVHRAIPVIQAPKVLLVKKAQLVLLDQVGTTENRARPVLLEVRRTSKQVMA
jgi:hypothetical protein